jgi:hypothetical protein
MILPHEDTKVHKDFIFNDLSLVQLCALVAKKLQNSNVAVLLLNRNPSERIDIKLRFNDIDLLREAKVKDIYLHKDLGYFKNSITRKIDPHLNYFFIL